MMCFLFKVLFYLGDSGEKNSPTNMTTAGAAPMPKAYLHPLSTLVKAPSMMFARRMPRVIIIWFMVTRVPLMETGLFSARYRGTIILARPTPPPTTNLDGERTVLVDWLLPWLPASQEQPLVIGEGEDGGAGDEDDASEDDGGLPADHVTHDTADDTEDHTSGGGSANRDLVHHIYNISI